VKFGVITLFPELFQALTEYGVSGRAFKRDLVDLRCFNPRDYTEDRHKSVDDRPYGGGPGMIMKPEPLEKAILVAKDQLPNAKVVYLSPQGQVFSQSAAQSFCQSASIILIAGRYEGIDERLIELYVDEEWSLGDFVLSGGEMAAMTMMDAIIRLLPGALGHERSAAEDSFAEGLLDCPHYTRPEVYLGREVPKVLLSGNHEHIRRWRLKQSLGRTHRRRPELLERLMLTPEQQVLLQEFIRESEDLS
jgi:tRNA (guanine37-N1)-methyltransferase